VARRYAAFGRCEHHSYDAASHSARRRKAFQAEGYSSNA
jgi:hypothetical protein